VKVCGETARIVEIETALRTLFMRQRVKYKPFETRQRSALQLITGVVEEVNQLSDSSMFLRH